MTDFRVRNTALFESIPAAIGVDVIAPSVDPTDQWTMFRRETRAELFRH